MRILQINNFEAIGGGSDRVYQLTTQMLLDRGHELATLSCGEHSFDERKRTFLLQRNGYIERNPLRTLHNVSQFISRPQAAQAIDKIVAEFKPDVAHLHIFYGQLSSSVLTRLKAHRIPTVMTVHEYRMICPVSTLYTEKLGVCERCAGGHYMNAISNRCNRNSTAASILSALEARVRDQRYNYLEHIDHFLMVSRFCLDKHAQYMPDIRSRASVLYNFVELDAERTQSSVSRTLLYCGRLSQEKGLDLLCGAMKQRPDVQLLIAGDGPLGDSLRVRYAKVANIQFLGKLDAPTLRRHIREAWFTIAPSEWYENNPMAILESFASGTPVIGAAIGGIPELVVPDQTGLLFAPSNQTQLLAAIDTAMSMSALARSQLSDMAVKMVEQRHSAASHYAQLMVGYQAAAARSGKA